MSERKGLVQVTGTLPDVLTKISMISRGTSQISRKFQSLTMFFPANSTYRVLVQVLAQIENVRIALTDNLLRMRKQMRILKVKQERYQELSDEAKVRSLSYAEKLELANLESELESAVVQIKNTFPYFNSALKELGFLTETYEQIKRNKGIPDDWDERDYEIHEIEAHVMGVFRNAVRDYLSTGRPNWATCEWWEQLGISPIEGCWEVEQLIAECNEHLRQGELLHYEGFLDWLESMAKKYHDRYKSVCKRIGLDEKGVISRNFTAFLHPPFEHVQISGNSDQFNSEAKKLEKGGEPK
jgi:hypothetical protein